MGSHCAMQSQWQQAHVETELATNPESLVGLDGHENDKASPSLPNMTVNGNSFRIVFRVRLQRTGRHLPLLGLLLAW